MTIKKDILVIEDSPYYAVTLTADVDGNVLVDTYSRWAGFDEDRRFELRMPREVYPREMVKLWNHLKESFQMVNNPEDFYKWFLNGGHALITRSMLIRFIPTELEPHPFIFQHGVGWIHKDMIPHTALNHAPTPKLRSQILKRDQARCLLCGQRPSLDVNVVLHVHHIMPHGKGGLTIPNNLITLCHTCHIGLDPHCDPSLYNLLNPQSNGTNTLKKSTKLHIEGVIAYRNTIRSSMQEILS